MTDPWFKLAAAYDAIGDRKALDKLVKDHPEAAVGIGNLYAADEDWERAIAELRKFLSHGPADISLLTRLAADYESSGRTREAVFVTGQDARRRTAEYNAVAQISIASGVVSAGHGIRRDSTTGTDVGRQGDGCFRGRPDGQSVLATPI